jgi:hypothetical protein
VAPFVAPSVRGACVLLRAVLKDGSASEVCATAEDLAPLVSEILAAREERGEPTSTTSAALVAFKMIGPTKLQAKRRCAVWVAVEPKDGGGRDGSTDGGR